MPPSGKVRDSTPSIVLYQLPRAPQAPSLSPFVVKLETYLRMANIRYTNNTKGKPSRKGKIPWLSYNGKAIADTNFIIEFLNENMEVDLDKHLNAEQKAVAYALQRMSEENLYWTTALMRWVFINKVWMRKVAGLPRLVVWILSRRIKKQAKGQGIGRHNYDEIVRLMENDIEALSVALGNKKFFTGDKPCQADAAIFGQLTQIAYQGPDTPGMKLVKEKYTNLMEYCERMKAAYWPDWDDCITHDGTRKATE